MAQGLEFPKSLDEGGGVLQAQRGRFPDKLTLMEPLEGLKLAVESASAKFTETVEVHFRMNLNPKYTDQQLRATCSLPKVWKSFLPRSV